MVAIISIYTYFKCFLKSERFSLILSLSRLSSIWESMEEKSVTLDTGKGTLDAGKGTLDAGSG